MIKFRVTNLDANAFRIGHHSIDMIMAKHGLVAAHPDGFKQPVAIGQTTVSGWHAFPISVKNFQHDSGQSSKR
jgi:hypothetical protein